MISPGAPPQTVALSQEPRHLPGGSGSSTTRVKFSVQDFFLHHRLKELDFRVPSPAEISTYYFQMTEEQRFAGIRSDLDEQEELDRVLLRSMPAPRDLEQMNEDLRAVYEQWHALHPTALGNCGCPGLCPRGNDRALCLGCSYLVTDPEKLGVALTWRASYAN